MWKHLLIMAILLVGLVLWDLSMSGRTARSRAEGVRIERLLNPAEVLRAERPVAALRLERGDGSVHLYARADGVWRCATAFGTVVLEDSINTLFAMLAGPEYPENPAPPQGVIQSRDSAAARDYGFDTPQMLALSLCGPDVLDDPTGDVIYSLDIGHSISATGGSYVRPTGTNDVWAVNVDFRKVLAPEPDSMVPPMLDPHILPAAWPGFRPPGVERIVIEVPNEPPLELQRIEREGASEDEPAWQWTVKQGERTYVGDTFQIFSYGGFLTRTRYAGILGPHDPRDLGLDNPRGRITLRSAHGLHIQLVIGQRAPRGGVPVFNSFSRNIFEVDPATADLLLPEMDMLLFDHLGNPWEQFLR